MKKSIIAVIAVVVILTATAIPVGAWSRTETQEYAYSTLPFDQILIRNNNEKSNIDYTYSFQYPTTTPIELSEHNIIYDVDESTLHWNTKRIGEYKSIKQGHMYYTDEITLAIPPDIGTYKGYYEYMPDSPDEQPDYYELSYNIELVSNGNKVVSYEDLKHIPRISANGKTITISTTLKIGIWKPIQSTSNANGEMHIEYYEFAHTQTGTQVDLFENILNQLPATYFNANNDKAEIYMHTQINIKDFDENEYCELTITQPYRDYYIGTSQMFMHMIPDGSINLNPTKIEINGGIIEWLSNVTSGFFNTEIFGSISIGDIVWVVIGIGVLFAVLKIFSK